jgi:hypothetical protein
MLLIASMSKAIPLPRFLDAVIRRVISGFASPKYMYLTSKVDNNAGQKPYKKNAAAPPLVRSRPLGKHLAFVFEVQDML